ncbi:hypothetical protein IWW37_003695 [Coemansia sp. RSA 2050]|nr:hypothetical protein IWW37_003695 [Coemansia sp. RSA 2050]KAJ2736702.1 hypothetical protein IW152_000671 [Coemansia sp. BCRC 34962]
MSSYREQARDLTSKVKTALEKREGLDKDYLDIRTKIILARAENNQLLDMLVEAYPEVDDNFSSDSSDNDDSVLDASIGGESTEASVRRKRDYIPLSLAAHDSANHLTKRRRNLGPRENRAEPKQVESLQRDSHGSIILPASIGKGQDEVQIHSLGRVVWDRDAYHTPRYIWTVGFKSTRMCPSLLTNNARCLYSSEILDGGDSPVFQVTAEDMPEKPFRAMSSSGAWKQILDQLTAKGVGVKTHASGPQMYGLSHLGVTKAIQELDDVDKCQKYIRQAWVDDGAESPHATTDDDNPHRASSAANSSVDAAPEASLRRLSVLDSAAAAVANGSMASHPN